MSPKKCLKILLMPGLFAISAVQAADLPSALALRLEQLGVAREAVRTTPVEGLYELQAGRSIYYITADGRYLLAGNLVDIASNEDLTDTRMKGIRLDAIKNIADDQMISYTARKQVHQVTVFTDIDCAYCRKLHVEMDAYNALGISINYLLFPRAGVGSDSYNKAVSVWCSEDRNTALTDAKAGEQLPEIKCDNPVVSHLQLGAQIGVTGTPLMITEQGDMLPGYMSPVALKRTLETAIVKPAKKAPANASAAD